jgi:hypothetical protein
LSMDRRAFWGVEDGIEAFHVQAFHTRATSRSGLYGVVPSGRYYFKLLVYH